MDKESIPDFRDRKQGKGAKTSDRDAQRAKQRTQRTALGTNSRNVELVEEDTRRTPGESDEFALEVTKERGKREEEGGERAEAAIVQTHSTERASLARDSASRLSRFI
ncbi:hypothetical protein KM043_010946 [Ampulex compressa]|nr:hypothetical protein KM043_010946 [Ampulex compressa]